ncbi:glycosyltransferase family 2 protein [Lentithecium fluviatile CBS 122367]|uniref:Glycosyltransferase family 2 protein n=1 Tax=Lentithecium fluviatile CBS 122367 TaxID=1168545 RepID=A0A6G1JH56_9PLEO|nr:glycosyltransferase family 2 protein [Lentithecium fluviatile CBS 122367]
MPKVNTSILIIPDDHTYWPSSPKFIPSLLAPFENPKIGSVAPALQTRHHDHPISFRGLWNFLGMTCLMRNHAADLATNTIDGRVPVLTGRFGMYRSQIWKDPEFLSQYLNEYITIPGICRLGPLNVDDDKSHTRWLANHGWDIKIQSGEDSTLMTELGVWPRFHQQILRWTRTSWRTVPRTLFVDQTCWQRFPYTTYASQLP